LTVDLLPSLRGLKPEDLCDTGLARADGKGRSAVLVAKPHVVAAHFRWMRDAGVDGAAVQRFVAGLSDPIKKSRMDHVLKNVQAAAEATGRVFFVTYDISGPMRRSRMTCGEDWRHLVNDLRVTSSKAYLRDHGKPVLELWGFGFSDRPGNSEDAALLIDDLKSGQKGLAAVTLMGGCRPVGGL